MGEVRALKTFQTCKQYNIIQPCLTQHLLLWNHNTVILPRFMFGLFPHVLTFKWSEHDSQHWNLGQLDDSLHYVAPIQLWFRDVDFLSLTSTNDNAWWIIKSTVARGKQNPTDHFFEGATNYLGWQFLKGQRVVVYFSNRLNMLHAINFSDWKILVFFFPQWDAPISRPLEIDIDR